MKNRKILVTCLLILLVTGCGGSKPKSQYAIKFSIDDTRGSEQQMIHIKSMTSNATRGHVYANAIDWDHRGLKVTATVTDQNGIVIDTPNIQWSTDIPNCIRLDTEFCQRADQVFVTPFPGSQMGRGFLFADYQGERASLSVSAYGFFRLTDDSSWNLGWDIETKSLVPKEQADIWVEGIVDLSQKNLTIHSRYGIKILGDCIVSAQNFQGFFEDYPNQSEDGFLETADGRLKIYEIKDRNGNHYKLATPTMKLAYPSGSFIDFAWDYFAETTP